VFVPGVLANRRSFTVPALGPEAKVTVTGPAGSKSISRARTRVFPATTLMVGVGTNGPIVLKISASYPCSGNAAAGDIPDVGAAPGDNGMSPRRQRSIGVAAFPQELHAYPPRDNKGSGAGRR
jgi:hypothetical protein